MTKQLEALISLPALVITIALFLDTSWQKKISGLMCAAGGLFVGAGWWVALVECIPADKRPYIGGSENNDFIELTYKYNGLGRITSSGFTHGYNYYHNTGYHPGKTGPGLSASLPGWSRFFYSADAGQVGWLLGLCFVAIVIFGWVFFIWKLANRTQQALLCNWVLTFLTMFGILSFMGMAYHTYYPAIMAPAIGVITGIFLGYLWQQSSSISGKILTIGTVILVTTQACLIYFLEPDAWKNMLWVCATIGGLTLSIIILVIISPQNALRRYCAAIMMCLALSVGPLMYCCASLGQQFPGLPKAGPVPFTMTGRADFEKRISAWKTDPQNFEALTRYISVDADKYQWAAAAIGTFTLSDLQLRSGYSMLPIGGFVGFDKNVPCELLQQYITEKKIHYFIAFDQNSDFHNPTADAIVDYIKNHFKARKFLVNGLTIECYDLTQPL